jgi:phosphoribosyl 1,2-cyclic phosphodiesterase
MRITLWGTRGSLPAAGPETVRYGGNTSCVEVRGRDGTILVLDAGTGIRRLGAALNGQSRIDILLTHLHMDHVVGLGFFDPIYDANVQVHIWGPPSEHADLASRLQRYLSPPLFPVRLRDLPRPPILHDTPRGQFSVGCFTVDADLICHPGITMGFRIANGRSSIAYMPDHEPALGSYRIPDDPQWTSGTALARDVSLLIHDAQYTDAEYEEHVGWGHSTIAQACDFASMAHVERLVTFHHDPSHDDDSIDRFTESVKDARAMPFELTTGAEGARFELPD